LGLLRDLRRGPVALDTSIFVYFIEEHPKYLPLVDPVFEAIAAGELSAVTSSVTLLEALVIPFRFANANLIRHYENLLTDSRGLHLIDIDLDLLRAAAQLRAATRLKTPDALQMAAALSAGCPVFLANDGRLPALPGLRVLQLDDYLPESS
jgi:predicted nucleic acid-binding protein